MRSQTLALGDDTLIAMERIGQVLVETYRVERVIAEGGMAYVFEASHVRIPKRFAVKFLKLSLVNNSEALLRFRREAEIIATLDHPNIVNLVDYNISDDGVPYIVMEFLDGEHLGKRLSRGKLELKEALRIAQAVTSALNAAHAREIIHRDLKPENIILCKGDVVKVVDFGVAKLRGGPELTAFNTILGTIAYMAPEQITAKPVDARTDQYALGTIIYELLAGARPGDPATVAEQAMKILYSSPPPLPDVSAEVNAALARATAKNPLERFATCDELMEALHAASAPVAATVTLLDELPPLAGEPTSVSYLPPVQPELASEPSGQFELPLPGVSSLPTAPLDRQAVLQRVTSHETMPMETLAPPPDLRTPPSALPLPGSMATTLPPVAKPYVEADTLKPRRVLRDEELPAQPTGVGARPNATTLRGAKSYPLWVWFTVGLVASGGLATAVWFLVQHR